MNRKHLAYHENNSNHLGTRKRSYQKEDIRMKNLTRITCFNCEHFTGLYCDNKDKPSIVWDVDERAKACDAFTFGYEPNELPVLKEA